MSKSAANYKIYKYPFPITDEFVIEIPAGNKILLVDVVNSTPVIYALVNPNVEKIPVHFRIYGTGHDIADQSKLEFAGTFHQNNDNLIWHVFKVLEI